MTIRDAAHEWVERFNAIPYGIVEKLMDRYGMDMEVIEITPPCLHDRVYITGDEWADQQGEIVETKYDGEDDLYLVKLDTSDEEVVVSRNDFDVENDDYLPMWGTMWTFGEQIDEDWLLGTFCEPHLQEMADCGFRIYEQEDFGVIFGIDGAGYDFYEEHWIPLYKARGLKWHKEENDETDS